MFVFFSLSMEIPVNGGRSATAICFHNPVNNIFHCFSCVFFVCFRFREWTSQKSCGRSSSRSWSSTGNLRHQATNENYIFLSRCIVVNSPTVYIFFFRFEANFQNWHETVSASLVFRESKIIIQKMPIEKKKSCIWKSRLLADDVNKTVTRQSFRESIKSLREFLNYFEVQGQSLFGRD